MPAAASSVGRCAVLRPQTWLPLLSTKNLAAPGTRTFRLMIRPGDLLHRRPLLWKVRESSLSRNFPPLKNGPAYFRYRHQKARSSVPAIPNRVHHSYRPVVLKESMFTNVLAQKLNGINECCNVPEYLEAIGLRNVSAQEARQTLRKFKEHYESPDGDEDVTSLGVTSKDALRQSFLNGGLKGLDVQLKYALRGFIAHQNIPQSSLLTQASIMDLRYPAEWYPGTRQVQRTIHLHIGPTNSGKTYHALKRLAEVKRGIYAGPLRLLAHEVHSRFNAMGKPCHLITGDERILAKDVEWNYHMAACTVEMVPINVQVEVGVIDEIQMLANADRGWAWTQAFLGLQAKELHVCGEERALPLVTDLAATTGDKLVIHRYKRLSPLRAMATSLNEDLTKLRKGDCVVMFSRVGLHAMKLEIEKVTKKRVAIIYGGLPPETRTQQAELFNNPDNDYDILVASDAIGMGLNLSIKRIVFESLLRQDGDKLKQLPFSDIKQIAGRAGRFRTAAETQRTSTGNEAVGTVESLGTQNLGLVTTLSKKELKIVQKAMHADIEPLQSAGIKPPDTIYIRFASYFPPDTPLSYIMLRTRELARIHPRYFLCTSRDEFAAADVLHTIPELRMEDRLVFCVSPSGLKTDYGKKVFAAFARCVAERKGGGILDIPEVDIELLDAKVEGNKEYVQRLEALHHSLVLYTWLSFKFGAVFNRRATATHIKNLVEERIDKALEMLVAVPRIRKARRKQDVIDNLAADDVPDKLDAIEKAITEVPYSMVAAHPEQFGDQGTSLEESQMLQSDREYPFIPNDNVVEQRVRAEAS